MCHTSATLCAVAATPDLCTLRLAVEPSGHPVKGSELKPFESSDKIDHIFEEGAYINEGIPSGSYCTVDFSGGVIYTNSNEEDHDCTDDQGVEAERYSKSDSL